MSDGSVNPIQVLYDKVAGANPKQNLRLPGQGKALKMIERGQLQPGKLFNWSSNYRTGYLAGAAFALQNRHNTLSASQQDGPKEGPKAPTPDQPGGFIPTGDKPFEPAGKPDPTKQLKSPTKKQNKKTGWQPSQEKEMEKPKQKPNEEKKWRQKVKANPNNRNQPVREPRAKRKGK